MATRRFRALQACLSDSSATGVRMTFNPMVRGGLSLVILEMKSITRLFLVIALEPVNFLYFWEIMLNW